VTIIIITFNSEKYILKCLEETINNTPKNWKLTIVDNNSSDDTCKTIISKYRDNLRVKLHISSSNQGFAKAVNIGIRKSQKSNYYLLLNPDVVPNKSSFLPLVKCCEKMKAGICGGLTMTEFGEESGCYFRLPSLFVGIFAFTNFRKLDIRDKWHKYFYYKDIKASDIKGCFDIDVVTGEYMLIKSETIKKIGLFDERFFMYLEDDDYCKRAKDNKIKIVHCDNSYVLHYSGRSSQNKDGIRHSSWMVSRKKYFLKHFGIIENLIIQPISLVDDVYFQLNKILKG